MDAKIGADDENTLLRIIIGETRAAEQGCYFEDGPVQLIVKCSDDAVGEPAKTMKYSTIDGQEVRRLHFPVQKWSYYVNNLASIILICMETWLNGNGVFFHCDDGATDTPAGVAAILSEATGLSPFFFLSRMPKGTIKTQKCVQLEDVLVFLEHVRQGLHRSSSQCTVSVAVSPGVRTDISAARANQSRSAVSDRVPEQCVNEVVVEESTHMADSLAAERKEPTRPCRYTDVRQMTNETKASSPASVTPAAVSVSSRTPSWTSPSTWTAASFSNSAWQADSETYGGTWATAGGGGWARSGGGGGRRGVYFQCYTCGGHGHKSEVCPTVSA